MKRLIVLALLGVLIMSISETIKVYIDWDEDGFTAADEIQGEVEEGSITLGITDPENRVAQVGLLSLTVDNSDRDYSPLYSSGAHYGKLDPVKPIKVTADVGTEVDLFTGTIVRIMPASNLYGDRRVMIEAVDRMDDYQRDTELTIPLQQNVTADVLLNMIGAALYQTDSATAEIYQTARVSDGDTVTVDGRTYTFKSALTPAANEVYNDNVNEYRQLGMWPEMENLAAAINVGPDPDERYGGDTTRHPTVAALGYPALGVPDSERDTAVDLGDTATGYTGIATSFGFGGILNKVVASNEPTELPFRRVLIPMWKVGNPTGRTITVKLQLPVGAGGEPSGTLAYTGATVTMDAGSLSATAGSYVEFDFPDTVIDEWSLPPDTSQLYWVTVEIDGSASAADYVRVGADAGAYVSGVRFRDSHNTGSGWSTPGFSDVMLIWLPGVCDLLAPAPGTWGNSLTVSESSSALEIGSTFSGGTDPTSDYETGTQAFAYAGDTFASTEDFNVMVAIEQIVNSEYGLFAVGKDGGPLFKNKDYLFAAANDTPLALDNTHAALLNPRITRDDVRNLVTIIYVPRNVLSGGVIARAGRSYRINPGTGVERWTKYIASNPQATTFKLPIKDPTTEKPMAATSVDPLFGGTNYTVTTQSEGGGIDVTSKKWGEITFAVSADEIEVTVVNRTNQVLYINDLYFAGVGLVRYDQDQLTRRNESSIETYGKMPYAWSVPLQAPDVFIDALAGYFLRDPDFRIDGAFYDDPVHAASQHLFSVSLFDLISISDDQLAINGNKYVVVGMDYVFAAGDVSEVTFYTRDVGTYTYWLLGTSGFSELGATTRLSL